MRSFATIGRTSKKSGSFRTFRAVSAQGVSVLKHPFAAYPFGE